MKYLITALVILSVTGCKKETTEYVETIESNYKMHCASVGKLIRCENNEVICYKPYSYDVGVSCHFKEKNR